VHCGAWRCPGEKLPGPFFMLSLHSGSGELTGLIRMSKSDVQLTGTHMKKLLAEWLWRVAIVCALGWGGWELHQIRLQLQQPDEEATTATAPDDLQDSLDDLNDGIAKLNEKVDAMMVAMLQFKR